MVVVQVPDLGENQNEGDVIRVIAVAGQVIARDEPILEIETEKATIELPSPQAGRVENVLVRAGDHIRVGAPILVLDDGYKEPAEVPAPPSAVSTTSVGEAPSFATGTVFLVHGHNDAVKEMVARFLEKLSLAVTILHEQPNKGRTVIEKFIDYSKVDFAVVLLTGDDRGSAILDKDRLIKPRTRPLRPRARQNVIFEFGFFLGTLGRQKVCALYEDGVEIPSDYSGVVFIKLDADGYWKWQLARELRDAGVSFDVARAL